MTLELGEYRFGREEFLSGGIPLGKEPVNAYKTLDPPAKEELALSKSATSRLGKIVESAVTYQWAGPPYYAHKYINEKYLERLFEAQKLVLQHRELHVLGIYDSMADEGIGLSQVVGAQDFVKYTDELMGTDFVGVLETYGLDVFKYVLEASVATAQEVTHQVFWPSGFVMPDMRFNNSFSGLLQTQIDAVEFMPPPVSGSYEESIKQGIPYNFISVKTLFREKYTETSRRLMHPRRNDKVQAQQQMAKHASWLFQRGIENNLFPSNIIYVYLRGGYPAKVYSESIDEGYIYKWLSGVEDKVWKVMNDEITWISIDDPKMEELIDYYQVLFLGWCNIMNENKERLVKVREFAGSLGEKNQGLTQSGLIFDRDTVE